MSSKRIKGPIEADGSYIKFKSGATEEVTLQAGSNVAAATFTLPAATDTLVGRASTDTLTNKTINGDNNTVQDLPLTSLKTVLADANKAIVRDGSGAPTSALIANANVDESAAIAVSKLAALTATRVAATDASGFLTVASFAPADVTTLTGSQTLTNKTLTTPIIDGQASDPTYAEGRVWYDTTDDVLRYYNEDTTDSVAVGQELVIKVRNNSGSAIPAGSVVYCSGSNGQVPTIALAQANSFTTSRVFGVTPKTINNNTLGYVTFSGLIRNIDTSAFSAGDQLFLSSSAPGGLTATRPSAPNFAEPVATVARSNAVDGRLVVEISNAVKLGLGAANQILGMNSGGTGEEYINSTGTGDVVRASSPSLTSPTISSGATVRGSLLLQNTSGSQPTLELSEDPDNGTDKVTIQAPASLAASYTLTLPTDDGSNGQVLSTDGAGALSWVSPLTNPMTTQGDIITGGVAGAAQRLALGAADRVLIAGATDPAWGLITNANIDASAAIARSKLAAGTASHVVINDGSGNFSSEASLDETRGGTAQTTYATGDILYASAADTLSKLSGNTATTKKWLRQVGNGSTSAAPSWEEVDQVKGDTAGTAKAAGYVGEMFGTLRSGTNGFTYSTRSTTAVTTSNASLVSQTLNKGVYIVFASCTCYTAAVSQEFTGVLRVGGTAVTNSVKTGSSNTNQGTITFTVPVVISADSTAVDVFGANSSSTSTVATHEIWAVRIA